MASLFDDIFKTTSLAGNASLFSQNSKFRAATAINKVAVASIPYAAPEQLQDSHKLVTKPSKKRKARELELPEPMPAAAVAEPSKKTKPSRASENATNGTNQAGPSRKPKGAAPSSILHAQADQTQSPAQVLQSKNKKRKTASDETKQSKITAAALKPSKGAAVVSGTKAPLPAPSVPSQDNADAEAAAEEELALQKLSPEEQAERLRRTVFVGNLAAGIQRRSIRKEFKQYGSVESIRLRSVPVKLDAKMSRRAAILTGNVSKERGTSHAYIVFQQEDSAVAALASNMHVLDNLHIRVDRAGQTAHGSSGGSVVYERNRTVFVGNLPFDVEDEELIVLFNASCSKLGISDPVDAVRVVRDSASQLGKGFGFVQFTSPQAARAALGCDGQLLRKRSIRVTKALKVSANLKQLGQKQAKQPERASSSGRTASDGGQKQPRVSNKAVSALQRTSEPADNWQGFKTKGSKKATAGAAVKNAGIGQRPVAGKRKALEKRASVAARKQKTISKKARS